MGSGEADIERAQFNFDFDLERRMLAEGQHSSRAGYSGQVHIHLRFASCLLLQCVSFVCLLALFSRHARCLAVPCEAMQA